MIYRAKSPMTAAEILDLYFLENRARLLEVASFLDRLERAADPGTSDFRHAAFVRALEILLEPGPGRTERVQVSLSDPSSEPIASAAGLKAVGAWQGEGA